MCNYKIINTIILQCYNFHFKKGSLHTLTLIRPQFELWNPSRARNVNWSVTYQPFEQPNISLVVEWTAHISKIEGMILFLYFSDDNMVSLEIYLITNHKMMDKLNLKVILC